MSSIVSQPARVWTALTLGAAVLLLSGCRGDPNVPLLERELRLQEDQIYKLQDSVEEFQSALNSSRRENEALRREISERGKNSASGDSSDRPSRGQGSSGGSSSPLGGSLQGGPRSLPGDAQLVPPSLSLPPELDKPGKSPDASPRRDKANGSSKTGMRMIDPVPKVETNAVKSIKLNGFLTGGYDSNGKAGDEGVSLFIETFDVGQRLVEAAAPVTIVVLDPALEGEAARVARWDFTTDEVAGRFRRTPLSQGVLLELPWPAAPPKHNKLQVFVRYTTPDGRQLEAQREIQIDLPGQQSRKWTPGGPGGNGAPPAAVESHPPADESPAELIEPTNRQPTNRPSAPPSVAREPKSEGHARRPTWSPNRY